MTFSIERRALAAESTNSNRRNSIIVPTDSATDENFLVIDPSSTNRVRHDGFVIGSTNISDLHEVLQLYADVRGRTIRWSTNLSFPNFNFTADKPLTPHETTLALDALFGLNGIALIDIDEKWVKAARSESCQTSGNLNYETVAHFQHLTYLKPSELIPVLQPFSSEIANPILPLNAEQAVLLRDRPENVQKMQEVIREVDVATPTNFVSEVIALKYAKASEIAAVLDRRFRFGGEQLKWNFLKMMADTRSNSLLVYAEGEDMKRIKQMVSKLDIVAAQILIEAVIVEFDRTNGFAIHAIDNQELSWTTNFVSNVVTSAPPVAEAIHSSEVGGQAGFYRFAALTNDLDSLMSILATSNSARILQRPRIQTSDGEPAHLFVGEYRPLSEDMYPSGSYTCGSPLQFHAINLGVTLELTPSITSDKSVTLDIHQFIEKANGSVTLANVGEVPVTHRTELDAKVTLPNRDVLLLDGLVERVEAPPQPRPSTFKRVLTLNGLFHHSKSGTNQNEIIILIRPTILPTPEVAQLYKAEKERMPGKFKRAELEIQSEEANRLKQLEKNLQSDRDQYRK